MVRPASAPPPPAPATKRGLLKSYEHRSREIQRYFDHLPNLIDDYPLEVALSYVFGRVELAHNMSLYCGIVKLHKAAPSLVRAAVDKEHITRTSFQAFFEAVYGKPIGRTALSKLKAAERVRDKVMHGKQTNNGDLRGAIDNVLGYAQQLNVEVERLGGAKPFGDLRGFKGRGKALDKSTTRWMLKGMGFTLD